METTSPNTRQALIGIAFIVLAAIGFSSKSILINLIYADSAQIDAITLMTLRRLLALPFFLCAALWKREQGTNDRHPSYWIAVVFLCLTGYYLASLAGVTRVRYWLFGANTP